MPSAKDIVITDITAAYLVVGEPGSGKSIFASTFPTPGYVFDYCDGMISYKGIDFEYDTYQQQKGWHAGRKKLNELEKLMSSGQPFPYKTVVVDECTALSDCAMAEALALDPKRSLTGGPLWNVHYQMVRNLVEGFIRQIIRLSKVTNVVVLCHLDFDKDEEKGTIIKAKPLMTGQLSEIIPSLFSEVYYTAVKNKGQEREWVLQTVPIGYNRGRSRLSGKDLLLGKEIPNEYPKLLEQLQNLKKGGKIGEVRK